MTTDTDALARLGLQPDGERDREQIEEDFMSAVWAALKADANDLRKQQRILKAFRSAICAALETVPHGRDE